MSDHLCWTGVHGKNLHDLLPIPYTEEALDHVVSRVQLVQDFLGRAIALENVSTYVQFNNSEMTEWEFLSELSRRTGCWLLFDVNNVYVSAFNHGYDPLTFLNGIPADRVVQFHMAGHSHMGTHIIDTHDHPVCEDVWELYEAALRRFGQVSTMIERDDNIPPLDELLVEVDRTREIAEKVLRWARRRDERFRAAAGRFSARHPGRRRQGARRNSRQPQREARDAVRRLSLRLWLAAGRGAAQRSRTAACLSRRRDVRRDGARLCRGEARRIIPTCAGSRKACRNS